VPETSGYRDALRAAHDMAVAKAGDGRTFIGYGVAALLDGDGRPAGLVPFGNQITDAGDAYCAAKIIAAISPATPAAPTAANGMKLGSATTTVAKSGAGAFIGTYVSGSNLAFDSTYPQTANLGAGLGVNAVYRTTWAAGVATGTINEVTIVNDQGTATGGSAANTYSRAVITTVTKGASDSLVITYNWKCLG
jgi:hypothetical protein